MNVSKEADSNATEFQSIIDSNVYTFFVTLNYVVISPVVGVFGIVANIINIVNFKRQGYQDGINVTLTALSISDIGSLVVVLFSSTIANPWLSQTDIAVVKSHLMTTMLYVHGYFLRVSGLITTFAAIERCLCVILPLKVKLLVNTQVAIIVNSSLFIILSVYMYPFYSIIFIDWKFYPEFNKSLLSLYFKENRERTMTAFYYIGELLLPYSTVSLLVVCTSILIRKLKQNSMWRQSASNADVYKERKLIVMLSTISLIFVVCTLPLSTLNAANSVVRSLTVDRPLYYIAFFFLTFALVLDMVNSSVSIFIYYKMSSRYRREFRDMMSVRKQRLCDIRR